MDRYREFLSFVFLAFFLSGIGISFIFGIDQGHPVFTRISSDGQEVIVQDPNQDTTVDVTLQNPGIDDDDDTVFEEDEVTEEDNNNMTNFLYDLLKEELRSYFHVSIEYVSYIENVLYFGEEIQFDAFYECFKQKILDFSGNLTTYYQDFLDRDSEFVILCSGALCNFSNAIQRIFLLKIYPKLKEGNFNEVLFLVEKSITEIYKLFNVLFHSDENDENRDLFDSQVNAFLAEVEKQLSGIISDLSPKNKSHRNLDSPRTPRCGWKTASKSNKDKLFAVERALSGLKRLYVVNPNVGRFGNPLPGITPRRRFGNHLPGITPRRRFGNHLPGITPRRRFGNPLPGITNNNITTGTLPNIMPRNTDALRFPGENFAMTPPSPPQPNPRNDIVHNNNNSTTSLNRNRLSGPSLFMGMNFE